MQQCVRSRVPPTLSRRSAAGIDPATYYLRCGAQKGRDPSALFDSDCYLAEKPDVAKVELNPLVHCLHTLTPEAAETELQLNERFEPVALLAHECKAVVLHHID